MIFKVLQFLYKFIIFLKSSLYKNGYFKTVQMPIPTISVGNLSVGGTGKTPCVEYLVRNLESKFKNISIVSRSYKGKLSAPQKVDLSLKNAAEIFGDEPCMLQKKLPQCQVWSGPSKSATAAQALTAGPPDLFVIDDGFSHLKLKRHFDLVLIDATATDIEMELLPVGRFREPFSALNRASAVVITKSDLVANDRLFHISNLITSNSIVSDENIFLAESVLQASGLNPNDILFVFCGLAKPISFKKSLEDRKFLIHEFKSFPDHHQYVTMELDNILESYKKAKINIPTIKLVVTAKDFVKLDGHAIANEVLVLDYVMTVLPNKKGTLIEKICSSI